MLGLYHAIFPFLLDWSNSGGKTALHVASQAGNADLVSLLLERGADAELTDLQGNTPLHYATAWGHEEAAEVLIREGEAMWTTRNAEGFMPGDYAWDEAGRKRLTAVWEDDLKRRRAQREEENREREREERAYEAEMMRMQSGHALHEEPGFDLSPRRPEDEDRVGEIGYDTTRRRASKQFDPSSLPYQARSTAASHAHWQTRVPLPARADSSLSVPSPQTGRQDARYQYNDGGPHAEWLNSPQPSSATGHPHRPALTHHDSQSSGPSSSGYKTPRWDVSPGLRTPGVEDGPISPPIARMAPLSAPSRTRPTMHHRRSSSMAQALGPGVTLAPPLSHISIEQQASGQAPLPALKYAEVEEEEEDLPADEGVEVESPVSYFSRPGDQKSPDQDRHQSEAMQGKGGLIGAEAKGDFPGQHALGGGQQGAALFGSTPARGTAAGPPVW